MQSDKNLLNLHDTQSLARFRWKHFARNSTQVTEAAVGSGEVGL